jgi:CBS domain-containing protein
MWMTKDVLTATPVTPLSDIARTMSVRHIRRMPIDADGRLVG